MWSTPHPPHPPHPVRVAGLTPIFMPLDERFLPQLEAVSEQEMRDKRARVMLLKWG